MSDYRQDLFEPASGSGIGSSVDWLGGALFGEVAVVLCVLAVAFVGFLLLTGRLAVREGARVMMGCILPLGAPLIAMALIENSGRGDVYEPRITQIPPPASRQDIEAVEYNPYAQASVRDDR
ncbi:TrbC/VirB2 family protein [Erythrobacter sp. GH1-10]|uniref:TrbC/VirB2 family protein n=1 Tax=Erythrobacter sp. GH1-10 TaxID=3349334 RepID=UPI00387820DD